jgi:hypothetical protein
MKNDSHSNRSYKRWLPVLTCCFLAFCSADAQSLSWTFVNATGYAEGVDGSLRWTIGEPLSYHVTGEGGSLRVGFMPYAYAEEVILSTHTFNPDLQISLYPNPATDKIRIRVPAQDRYQIHIFSFDGRSQLDAEITSETQIGIHSLPSGSYVLYVLDPKGSFNSISFIKS